ncbi:MAG: hypothetical protein U1E51_00660 [Candidatus Binatia bacterium]|nr:hypothetical protein [Candidatus Binatia bacterium]
MTLREWFGIDKQKRDDQPIGKQPSAPVPSLPAVEVEDQQHVFYGTGVLDPRSSTWIFVQSWAEAQLEKVREKNDSANLDLTQTSVLRGQIKTLKDLIHLPKPKRGLLIEDEE